MDSFLDIPDYENETPESLSWKLLMDDTLNDFGSSIIPYVDGEEYDQSILEDQFQILITIYLELIFNSMKLNHVENTDETDENKLSETFDPRFENININDLIDFFQLKFKKIRYHLHVHEIDEIFDDYYCKVILKNTPKGKLHYDVNKNTIDQSKYYTFAINRNFMNIKKQNIKINDYYAICDLNHMKMKIYFSPIDINL